MAKHKGLKNALQQQKRRQDEKVRSEKYEQRIQQQQQQGPSKHLGKKGASHTKDESNRKKSSSGSSGSSVKGKGKASASASTTSSSRLVYQPYRNDESVLLVGEGDFSFARTWASRFPQSARMSVATSYDSQEEAERKYPDTQENVEELRKAGVTVLFNVDAQKLQATKELKKRAEKESTRFDKVVFNFPHVGAGEKDEERNVKLNQILLLRFLKSVKPFLKESTAKPGRNVRRRDLERLRREEEKRQGRGREEGEEGAEGEQHGEEASTSLKRDDGLDDEGDLDMDSDPEELDSEDETGRRGGKGGGQLDGGGLPGRVLITLFTCKPYNLWSFPSLAKSGPEIGSLLLPFPESREAVNAQPRYRINRSFEFEREDWPGYEHRRTIGQHKARTKPETGVAAKESASLLDREHAHARTWELSLSGLMG